MQIALTIITVLFFWGSAGATCIDMLNETHHVWGKNGNIIVDEFDITSSSPVIGSATGVVRWNDNYYSLSAEAYAGDFAVGTHTELYYGYATAESTYIFQSQSDKINMRLSVDLEGDHFSEMNGSAFLKNLTTEEILLDYNTFVNDFQPDYSGRLYIERLFTFSLSPYDTYEFTISSWSTGSDEGFSTTSLLGYISADPQPVPEPTTMLLFVIGFSGFVLKRKLSKFL